MTLIKLNSENPTLVDVPLDEIEEFLDPMGFVTRAKYLYKIRTKDRKIVNYKPWGPQLVLDRVIREEHARSKEILGYHRVYLMYLKSRREGMSTDTSLRIVDKMLFNENYSSQVLAHDDEGTGILFQMYKRAFDELPDAVRVVEPDSGKVVVMGGAEWIIPIKPAGGATKRGIQFKDMSESGLIVQTAGKGDNAGKAGSLNAVHFSEAANYREYDELVSSVSQQLEGDDILGVKESTANGTTGMGEGFYDDWVSAEKGWLRFASGETTTFEDWRPVFIPWFWMEEYRKPLYKGEKISIDAIQWDSDKERLEYLEWEEKVESEIIPNDPEIDHNSYDVRESTNFYRDTIINKCRKKLPTARRYYPTTPEEAFVTSDKCFFNTNALITVEIDIKNRQGDSLGYKTGELNEDGKFVERMGAELKIKRFPEPGWRYRYVVSCDQSEGYEDGDFSTISVFDRVDREWVAYWNGVIPENELARLVVQIGYFYNNALLIPERNKTTVINLIKPDGYERYMGELYYQKVASASSSRREPNWGFYMNTASRKQVIDKLYAFLDGEENFSNNPEIGNYDKLFTLEQVHEYKHFIRDVSGRTQKYAAAQGYKDDIVIGDGLCLIGDEWWDRSPQKDMTASRKKTNVANISTSTRARSTTGNLRQSNLGKKKGGKKPYRVRVGGRRQSTLGK